MGDGGRLKERTAKKLPVLNMLLSIFRYSLNCLKYKVFFQWQKYILFACTLFKFFKFWRPAQFLPNSHILCFWVCFFFLIEIYWLQYYVSFRCTTYWFDICILYEMITMASLVAICCHTKLLRYYWIYSLCFIVYPHGLFIIWKFVTLIPFTYFLSPAKCPHSSSSGTKQQTKY